MKIAVNSRLLLEAKHQTGVANYCYQILKRLIDLHPEHEFHLLFDRSSHDDSLLAASNVVAHVLHPPARHPVLWYLWFEQAIPRWMARQDPDVFLSMDGHASLAVARRSLCPQIMVCHDIVWKHDRTAVSALVQRFYEYYVPRYIRAVDLTVAVSRTTSKELTQYGLSSEPIPVAPNGVRSIFRPSSPEEIAAAREKYTQSSPYYLFVGALHPRKNISRLIKAYDLLRSTDTTSSTKLVIVGQASWKTEEMRQTYEASPYQEDIIFTGYIDDAELVRVMGAALCLCYVSLQEGFGVPILEAMACDVPVITSNRSSMPEVAGDAALLVDPESITEINAAMKRIATDAALRAELIERGHGRMDHYSWDRSAEIIWDAIESLEI